MFFCLSAPDAAAQLPRPRLHPPRPPCLNRLSTQLLHLNRKQGTQLKINRADKALVVYFSATGTTRGVAEKIAALTDAELVEIVPAQPYTTEDLNYNDRTTRATVEQNTPDVRPEIANEISLDGYTTVYLGYPIWWGQAPRILSTFVESHDFTGITVIPFCTSGGSGAGRTGETLGEQAGSGTFLSSTRFSAGVSESDLQKWIESKN